MYSRPATADKDYLSLKGGAIARAVVRHKSACIDSIQFEFCSSFRATSEQIKPTTMVAADALVELLT